MGIFQRGFVVMVVISILLLLTIKSVHATADSSLYLYAKDGGKVIDHTDAAPMMAEKGPKVVEFYSPHCGGCKNFRPKYIEMANEIDEVSEGKVKVYAVSCVAHSSVCQNYDIHGYPSILTFTQNDEKGTYVKRSILSTKSGYDVKELVEAATKGSASASASGEVKGSKPPPATKAADPLAAASRKMEEASPAKKGAGGGGAKLTDDEEEEPDAPRKPPAPTKAEGGEEEDFKQSLKADSKVAGAHNAAKKPKDMDKMKEAIMKKRNEILKKKESKGVFQRLNLRKGAAEKKKSGVKGAKAPPVAKGTTPSGATKKGVTPAKNAATPGGDNKAAVPKVQAKQPRKENAADVPAQPGNTHQMLANTPRTAEYEAKRDAIIQKVQRAKQKKAGGGLLKPKPKPVPLTTEEKKAIFKKENVAKIQPKKQGFVARQVEKVPVIRQVIKKLTPEEELVSDAALSFVTSIRDDLFVGPQSGPMDSSKVQALKDWLQLLSISLPPEWGLHRTIDDLHHNIELIAKSQASLDKILKNHVPPRKTWSRSCAKGGYTCGLWKLIHIMSVGLAEHRGGLNLIGGEVVDVDTRVFSPMEAARVLRGYIDNFFSCNECRDHFIGMYDHCSFRRCDRLAGDSQDLEQLEAEDWKQFALWLWEVHNDVSTRVKVTALKEKKKKAPEDDINREAFISSFYPSIEQCVGCFEEDGSWIEPSVFAHLERVYWAEPDPKMDKILYGASSDETPAGIAILKLMIFFGFCLIIFLQRKLSTSSGILQARQTLLAANALRTKLEDKVVGKKRKA